MRVGPGTTPSGKQHEISGGGYSAVVTQVGAALRVLRHEGRDLVVPWRDDEICPVSRGALLAPWPNRIADGRYRFAGRELQLPVNEVERGTALHGLVSWQGWDGEPGDDGSAVVLATRVWPSSGYPFLLDVIVRYSLDEDGLACRLTARNAGDAEAPFGCAPHPYLVAGPGRVDDWTVEVPAERVLEVDDERLLPGVPPVTRPVEGTDLDLRRPRTLAGLSLDHAYTGLPRREVSATVRTPSGSGVEIAWDATSLPWVQVHTADRPEPEMDRVGLAVEPMTCPPDAFRSGVDLVVLPPGGEHTVAWVLRAL
jgi:aldose 1-epimerase